MKAKKKYGQNFLKNDTIIKDIVSLFDSSDYDTIMEIGPGRGALTKYLSQKKGKLICFEIDTDMKKYLDQYESDKCTINYCDILNVNLDEYQNNSLTYVIGNLPYYITTPIIEKFINSSLMPYKMIFMVQKEVGERICASPGNKAYGYLTLLVKYYYDAQIKIDVPRNNFDPIPNVDSVIIELTRNKRPISSEFNKYKIFLQRLFKQKRKTLKNNLLTEEWSEIQNILVKYHLSNNVRAEELSEEIIEEIFCKLY